MRKLIILTFFVSANLMGGVEISDPGNLKKKLGCRWSIFTYALAPVFERLVGGHGEIILIPTSEGFPRGSHDSNITALHYLMTDLRSIAQKVKNEPLTAAFKRIENKFQTERLVFCLLGEDCFPKHGADSVYVPLRLEEPDDSASLEPKGDGKKKRAVKDVPQKTRGTMKAMPKDKRPDPGDDEFRMPHVILVKVPGVEEADSDVSILTAVANSIVLYSEFSRIVEWRERNLKRKKSEQSALFARFEANPKLASLFKTVRSQSALTAIYEFEKPAEWKARRKEIMVSAVANAQYLDKELGDIYPIENINEKNIFEYIEMISYDLDQ